MSDAVRFALYGSIFLGVAYPVGRLIRFKQLQGTDIFEAIGLAFTPFPLPGAVEMITKALSSQTLPIFNDVENRAALVFGGLLLIIAFFYGLYIAVSRVIEQPDDP
jgi:hypothetical protein